MNKTTKLHNQAETSKNLRLTNELQAYKSGITDKPPLGDDSRPINKIPPPSIKPLIIACKCRNNKRENCVVKCIYEGKQFAFGQCPLCTCWCNHACTFENYFQGKAYKAATNKELKKSDADVEARKWMKSMVDVNQNATKFSGDNLEYQLKTGRLGKTTNIPAVACEHGALSAAMYAVNNPPPFDVIQNIRSKQQAIRPAKKNTIINIGGDKVVDVRNFSRTKATAADKRKSNNKLVLEVEESDSNDEIFEVPVRVVMQQNDNNFSGNLKEHTEYNTLQKKCQNEYNSTVYEMEKRIKRKIRDQRKNQSTTPNTKAAYAKILADIVDKSKSTAVAEVIKDYAEDKEAYNNSQDTLAHMVELKKNGVYLNNYFIKLNLI